MRFAPPPYYYVTSPISRGAAMVGGCADFLGPAAPSYGSELQGRCSLRPLLREGLYCWSVTCGWIPADLFVGDLFTIHVFSSPPEMNWGRNGLFLQ